MIPYSKQWQNHLPPYEVTMPPVLVAAIPTYNSSPILWLQLESLCRQENAPPFEVIVVEDPSDGYAGAGYVLAYQERLRQAGCVGMKYIPVSSWKPLPWKWRQIARLARAPLFMLCASDNYSPPDRLRETYNALVLKDAHWVDQDEGLFYNIKTGDTGLYRRIHIKRTGLFMATHTEMVRRLPDSDIVAGVDHWMRSNMKLHRFENRPGPSGLHTDGYNQISKVRYRLYDDGAWRKPFYPTKITLADVVPSDVAERLRKMRMKRAV